MTKEGTPYLMIIGKILIVGSASNIDHAVTENSIKDKLRKWGHEVVGNKNSDNLVIDVTKTDPQLIVLQAEKSNKEEVMKSVRSIRAYGMFYSVSLIVLLSEELKSLKQDLYQSGVNACLVVPVLDVELRACVQQHIASALLQKKLDASQNALEESLFKIKRQKSELDYHLALAAKIQESLIPSNLIQVPFCNFYCHFQPSGRVGGDIYDIFMLDDTHMGLYMVDVMGHGVASSMLAVALSEFLVVDAKRGTPLKRVLEEVPYYEIISPLEVIRYLNKRFAFSKYQHYFTIFYMVFNIESGELHYVRGAHPEPLLMRQNGNIETLNAYGTPVGFEFSQGYEEGVLHLNPGDRLMIYTDGLLELEDEHRENLDYDKLFRLAQEYMTSDDNRPFSMKFKRMADQQGAVKDDLTLIEMVWQSLEG